MWTKGMGSLIGNEFQCDQENVRELGYIYSNENVLDTQQLMVKTKQTKKPKLMVHFIVLYHKLPAYNLTLTDAAQARGME